MSNISINQASKLFKISRNTIYARIKQGEITKDAEGLVSVQDMIRLFGNKANKKATEQAIIEQLNTMNKTGQQIEQSNSNTEQILTLQIEQLKQQLAMKEILINQLQQQVSDLRQDKEQLYNQINQKRIEHKPENRKGLLGRFFG
jgi:chromosome segregation ATPase